MTEICECRTSPIYDGGGEWHCHDCKAEYDESEFNSKVLWLRDREADELKEEITRLRADNAKLAADLLTQEAQEMGEYGPTPQARVPEANNIRFIDRSSDFSVKVNFASCRAATAFEKWLKSQGGE